MAIGTREARRRSGMPTLTDGAAVAKKALVVDSNKDFTGVRNGTFTGTVTLGTLASTGIGGVQYARCTTQFDAVTGTTGATLTNIVGMTSNVIAAGVYIVEAMLDGVSTANSGFKVAIGGTATQTSTEQNATYLTASAVSNGRNTTATSGTAIGGTTAAITHVKITGTVVVNAAGTLTIMAAQNAAHADTTSVYVGSYMKVTRIA